MQGVSLTGRLPNIQELLASRFDDKGKTGWTIPTLVRQLRRLTFSGMGRQSDKIGFQEHEKEC